MIQINQFTCSESKLKCAGYPHSEATEHRSIEPLLSMYSIHQEYGI